MKKKNLQELTNQQKADIRNTYFSSNHTFASIQRIYNISYKTARSVIY